MGKHRTSDFHHEVIEGIEVNKILHELHGLHGKKEDHHEERKFTKVRKDFYPQITRDYADSDF